MVLGEIKVNLVLASSTIAAIINQSSTQIRRNTTLFSLAQRRRINLYYPSYEVAQDIKFCFTLRGSRSAKSGVLLADSHVRAEYSRNVVEPPHRGGSKSTQIYRNLFHDNSELALPAGQAGEPREIM
jgi:hypothetical protein